MSGRFRVVYFLPDPFLEERVAIAALVDTAEGVRVVPVAPFPAAGRFGSEAAGAAARIAAELLAEVSTYGPALPPEFSPQAVLGRQRQVPETEADAVGWVREHVLAPGGGRSG